MITATRGSVRENEDGSLHLEMTVHAGSKVAFFEAFPKPGLWAALAPAEKPPTQGAVAAAGPDGGAIGATAGALQSKALAQSLVVHPYFQQWAAEQTKPPAGTNAVQVATAFLKARCAGIGGLPSAENLHRLVQEFETWAKSKGYNLDG